MSSTDADVGQTAAATEYGPTVRHPRRASFLSLQRALRLDRHEHGRNRLNHDAVGATRASFVEALTVYQQQEANRLRLRNLPEPLAECHAVRAGQSRDDEVGLEARRSLDGRFHASGGHERMRAKGRESNRDAIAFFLGWGDQENQTSGQYGFQRKRALYYTKRSTTESRFACFDSWGACCSRCS